MRGRRSRTGWRRRSTGSERVTAPDDSEGGAVEEQGGIWKESTFRRLCRQAIQEYASAEQAKSEPAHKAELLEERKRREQLERRLNELVEENKRSRQVAEEAERSSAVRAELQRLGVAKVDLAFKAVQDGIVRTEDGRLVARGESGEVPVKDYLAAFVSENPEFLPARIPGGTGMTATSKAPAARPGDG